MSKVNYEEKNYKDQKLKHLKEMRKEREKETGEKYEAKYKMFIVPHVGFVSDLEDNFKRRSGRRYCFHIDKYEKAIDLTIEEVIHCISDCGSHYCNFRYKIIPEDEFLKEWEEYKKTHEDKLKESIRCYGFSGCRLNLNNILQQDKVEKMREWGMLMRMCYYNVGILGNPYNVSVYYSLITNYEHRTSAIVDYEITDNGIVFETMNSKYLVKDLKRLWYIDELKEFDDYKKSKYYKEFFDAINEQEIKVMNDLIAGKDYSFIEP